MGLLRFILALSVVFVHLGPTFGFIPMIGTIAVYSFYIISGFYMSLILNEKYVGKGSIKIFYTNRFLRIYPVYWVVLILTIFIFLILNTTPNNPLAYFFGTYPFYHGVELAVVSLRDFFTNVFLVTYSAYFLPIQNNSFSQILVIPLSWTLGLELLFYLVAPFIVRRRFIQILLFLIFSLILRIVSNHLFITQTSDTYLLNPAFFPSVLFLFILGSVSYRIYTKIKKINFPQNTAKILLLILTIYTLIYHYIPKDTHNIYLFLVFIFIPFIFLKFSNNTIDKFLGELSYPIYVSHLLTRGVLLIFFPNFNKDIFNLVMLFLIIAVAMVLHLFIEVPIDKFRQRQVQAKI